MRDRPKQLSGVCFVFLTALFSIPICAEDAAAPTFSPGETLTYDVMWSVFPAGQVVATLNAPPSNSAGRFMVKTTAQSKGIASLLYNVQDEFRSLFRIGPVCSERITKKINEGRRHRDTRIHFDYARKLAVLDERDPTNSKALPKHDEKSIPDCVQDVVSAFYYLRSQPLAVGKHYELAVNDGSTTTQVTIEVQAREQIQTGIGTREALRVEPKIFGSLYPRKGRMLIWFSDDSQHLPLRIQMTIGIGTIAGTLASVTHPGAKETPASDESPPRATHG